MLKPIFLTALISGLAATGALADSKAGRANGAERILNGEVIDGVVRKAQWMMSLRLDGSHWCGASFVSPIMNDGKVVSWNNNATEPKWAITAAHCVTDQNGNRLAESRLSVFSGALNIESGFAGGEIQQVLNFFLPDGTNGAFEYDPFSLEHDIAILQLSDPGTVTDVARGSIRLPTVSDSAWVYDPYTALYTAGWGRTSEGGVASPDLLEVRVPLVDRSTCETSYEPFNDEITRGMICAGYRSGEFDSCQGDSGGPLFHRPTSLAQLTTEPVLVGIVSWGRGCGGANLFGIYTGVAYYIDWVGDVIEKNS